MAKINGSLMLNSYEDWRTNRSAVKSGGTHWYRTSRLGSVNTALKNYFRGPGISRRLAVDDAIHKVRSTSVAAWNKYKSLLQWLALEMERRNPHTVGVNQCNHFGPGIGNQLNEMGSYAVTDLTSFPGSIRPGHVGRVWNRYYQMTHANLSKDGEAGARVRLRFDNNSISSASAFLNAGLCGCCTTFAARAADILLKGNCTSRIEVVAVPTKGRVAHCFVLVGRNGGQVAGRLPLPTNADWGSTYCVVDPWLAALGYPCIYPGGNHFPGKWLRGAFSGNGGEGLEQKFDSEANVQISPDDFRRGLKLRKVTVKEKHGDKVGQVLL